MAITLDGSFLEGGGQIARTALGLSTLLQKAFTIDKIRIGRPTPGLKAQHLNCINALKELCNADVEGAELGSTKISYIPRKLKGRTLSIDIGTAGSITLLLQSILIPLVFSGEKFRLKIKGGTDVSWSPSIDYFSEIILPQFRRFAEIEFKVEKRGYYPKGCGSIDMKIKSRFTLEDILQNKIPKIELAEQKKLVQIKGIAHCSVLLQDAEIAERMAKSAKHVLAGAGLDLDNPVRITTEYSNTESDGCGITLWAVFSDDKNNVDNESLFQPVRLGADALGEKGKKAELIGEECAKKLIEEIKSGAAVDRHMADNLVPLIGILGGKFRTSEITNHTKTNIYTVEQFLNAFGKNKKFNVDEENKIISLT